MNNVTTTTKGFRVEDITFRNARRQCEIENEIEKEEGVSEDGVQAPVSLTPEQVKEFYKAKISSSKDSNEKRDYSQTIKWIDELLDTKKKLFALESKEVAVNDDGTAEDIEEQPKLSTRLSTYTHSGVMTLSNKCVIISVQK